MLDLNRFQTRCKESGVYFQIGGEFTDGSEAPSRALATRFSTSANSRPRSGA